MSTSDATCTEPKGTGAQTSPVLQLDITLPPQLQAIGTYPLQGIGVGVGGQYDVFPCKGGTIQITSIDATEVVLTVTGAESCQVPDKPFGSLDGTYTAPRCTNTKTSAIAIPDPDHSGHLLLRLNDPGISCAHQKAADAYSTWSFLEISLPPEAQAVGTYSIAEIAQAGGQTCYSDPYYGCSGGSHWCTGGTVEITSIDASQVVFTITAPECDYVYAQPLPGAEGTFTAPRCN